MGFQLNCMTTALQCLNARVLLRGCLCFSPFTRWGWPYCWWAVQKGAHSLLGDDCTKELGEKDSTCEDHVESSLQCGDLHELRGWPQLPHCGTGNRGRSGSAVLENNPGLPLRLWASQPRGRLVPQGRWWHLRYCRQLALGSCEPHAGGANLLWPTVQALRQAGLHEWRSGLRAEQRGSTEICRRF